MQLLADGERLAQQLLRLVGLPLHLQRLAERGERLRDAVRLASLRGDAGCERGPQEPLGVGVLSAAIKKDQLDAAGYRALIACTTQLNTPGRLLSDVTGVHALTDVTGFGLLGHLLELCRGAGLGANVAMDSVPLLPGVLELANAGMVT